MPQLSTPAPDPLEIPLPPGLKLAGDAYNPTAALLAEQLEEAPEPEPLPDFSSPGSQNIVLPTGLLRGDTLITHAKVRELTGEDEEAIYREFNEKSPTPHEFLNVVLKQCVIEIGEEKPSLNDLKNLLIGDRSWLGLRIRELTYGPDWEVENFICRLCGETFGVAIELKENGDIKVKTLDDPTRQTVTVPLRKGEAIVRLVNGSDEDLANKLDEIPAKKTAIIDACLVSVNGAPVKTPVAKNMGLKDRDAIISALGAAAPGPRLGEVSVPCDKCGQRADYAINLADLFLV